MCLFYQEHSDSIIFFNLIFGSFELRIIEYSIEKFVSATPFKPLHEIP